MKKHPNLYSIIVSTFIFIFIQSSILAQDKVLMTNGKVLRGKIKTEQEDLFTFDYYKKHGKVKSIELSKYRVFSVTNAEGTEKIHYQPDSTMGYVYSVNEMRMYIYGQRDAFNAYQPLPMFILSYTVGLGSVIFDTYQFTADPNTPAGFFQRTPSMFPITVPLAFTIGAGLFAPKIRKEYASDISFMASEHYIMGFKKIAKYKRLKNAFFGSALGVISGFVVYGIGKP